VPFDCVAAPPGEVLSERLSVRPLAAGWLRVLGVSWLLAGAAEGYAEFDIKGRRRKRPKGERYAHTHVASHGTKQRAIALHNIVILAWCSCIILLVPSAALCLVQVAQAHTLIHVARDVTHCFSASQASSGSCICGVKLCLCSHLCSRCSHACPSKLLSSDKGFPHVAGWYPHHTHTRTHLG
jgi:hypothetical protein